MRLNFHALVALMLAITPVFAAKPLSFIYINASEGNASGGHVALRFDDDVYHYQYIDPGLIKLEKQALTDFEFNYRFLQNRSLEVSQLAVSDQTYDLLREYFDFNYQIQKQHFALTAELSREQALLQHFAGQTVGTPKFLQLPAAGFFYKEQDFNDGHLSTPSEISDTDRNFQHKVLLNLYQKIENKYGKNVIKQRLQNLENTIEQMKPTTWTEQAIQLKSEGFPEINYTFANRYLDAITAWMALNVIQQQRPLRTNAYRSLDESQFVLTPNQSIALQQFSMALQSNILNLILSSRPNRGSALLINLARLLVVKQSIQEQRLVILDSFDIQSEKEDLHQPRYRDELNTLYQDTLKNLRQVQLERVNKEQQQEAVYSQLEWLGNRFLELDKAKQDHIAIRWSGLKRIPEKSLALPRLTIPKLTPLQIQRHLQKGQQLANQYLGELNRLYYYDLIQRNCVTEIFITLEKALISDLSNQLTEQIDQLTVEQQSLEHLGGYISMSSVNFIPFVANQSVHNQYRIHQQRWLPSYRLQQLERYYAKENAFTVFLRESNTLSSTIYKDNPADSFFIFFTDQNVLLRPLYGTVNTLSGLAQSLLGLFSWPFDSGRRLQSGANGLVMSLPELVFFNMRKGSFRYVPYSKMISADERIVATGNR